MSTLLQLVALVAAWLIGHVPGPVWLVLVLVLVSKLFRRGPLLAGLGLAIGFRGVLGATRASHANPLMALVVVLVAAAALGHALGLGDGGPAPAAAAVPTSGDPFAGACRPVVTQPYGPTTFPGEPIVNGVRTHTGIDLACPAGTPVHAVGAGVAHVGFDSGFGNSVVVEGGGYFIRYAHLAAPAVQNGAHVNAGELVGWEGSTGYSTGPHLHFEVDQGAPSVQRSVNPGPFLAGA